ncbi:hypothetical protein B0H34DRAFT_819607 [Crassisporium funariophilum]|nr:hypothetical protein B0H34DRAFT_819607 [Crassisporium funariophilum]
MVTNVNNAVAGISQGTTVAGSSQATNSQQTGTPTNTQRAGTPTNIYNPVPVANTTAVTRIPRTHTSPTIIQMLKNLSLTNILKQNKKIEAENEARTLLTFQNHVDPVTYPVAGSETASLITIDPEDLNRLKSLFDTEGCVSVPLPFFLNKNLRIIIDEAATLPTMKSNPLPGETKGISILDIGKLADRFGHELSITCSQWTEAAENMYNFQKQRDKDGASGQHASWYDSHFNFFHEQRKRDELYDAWKHIELEYRKEHRSSYEVFVLEEYVSGFKTCAESAKLRAEMQEIIASKFPSGSRDGGYHSTKNSIKSPACRPFDRQNTQSFQPGSGRSPPSPSTCLICAERGHSSNLHLDSVTAPKFADGKATWAKCTSRGLVTPDNKSLCVNWNVRGDRSLPCTGHTKDEQAHLCSFCGSKAHNAFSWTCRPSPSHN